MSREIQWFLEGFYSVFDISGRHVITKKHSKKSGTYSASVSTDTNMNLNKSSTKVANAMRKEMATLN
jgi:hypothetical protein